MGRKKAKPNYRRIVLRLPDLDHSKLAVLNSLTSPNSRRVYQHAIEKFIAWYCSEPRLAFNRIVLVRYRIHWSRAHWQRRPGRGYRSGEGRKAVGPALRELAHSRSKFRGSEAGTW
jgi:hypothetical protein